MTSTIISAAVRVQPGSGVGPMMTGSRSVGAAVAFGIAAAAALVAFWLTGFERLAVGVPAAAMSGCLLGPRIGGRGSVIGSSFVMATLTIGIADAVVLIWLAGGSTSGVVETITGVVGLWLAGLVFVGIPMLVVALPCAVAWAIVVRKLAREGIGRVVPMWIEQVGA